MTAAWPITVNQDVTKQGYNEKPERNVAISQREVGSAVERRRSAISSDLLAFAGWYTSAEYDDLISFYRTTLIEGTQPFTRKHPRTGIVGTFKFTAEPAIADVWGTYFVVSHAVRRLDGGLAPRPPAGFTFLQKSDGQYLLDSQGSYILVRT